MATAVLLFSIYNTLTKWLAADYSPLQVMFFRGVFGLLPFAAVAIVAGGPALLRSRQPSLQVLRAALGLASNICFIFSYRELPLASAVAIGYAAPVLITFLSIPLLSERPGLHRSAAAVVGFAGVVLVAQPEAGIFSAGALLALAGTLSYSLAIILTRRLGSSDTALCTMIYSTGLYAVASGLLVPAVWVQPDLLDVALFALVGVVAGTALLLLAQGYRYAPASLLAPFDYTAIPWAALLGFMVWRELPGPVAFAGIATIIGAGMYLAHRERLDGSRKNG